MQNIYFGGIDYREQSKVLLKEAVSPLVVFYDRSTTGQKLAECQEREFMFNEDNTTDPDKSIVKFLIPKRTTNLESQLFENEDIVEGSFMVNTPIVKSSMIISQLTMYDTNATNVLSTQVNYDPLILSLTQYADRQNMIIANSITQNNSIFTETNALLGNDIIYDWINYTTTVGMDFFFSMATQQDRQYKIEMVENQMQYPIELVQPSKTRFIKYFSSSE
jgi:SRSO17 transposase